MRMLLVGTLPEAAVDVELELRASGHEVVRCHAGDRPAFPCAALTGVCPLEESPVDVAVTVRNRPWSHPSPFEDGAVCAVRRHIPLVAVDADVNPFAPWTQRAVSSDDDVAAVCEEAASAPLALHSRVATEVAHTVVERAGFDPRKASAVVHRRRGALKVTVELADAVAHLRGSIAARVVPALRELDPTSIGIDVGVAAKA
jgi:hypothetical protein